MKILILEHFNCLNDVYLFPIITIQWTALRLCTNSSLLPGRAVSKFACVHLMMPSINAILNKYSNRKRLSLWSPTSRYITTVFILFRSKKRRLRLMVQVASTNLSEVNRDLSYTFSFGEFQLYSLYFLEILILKPKLFLREFNLPFYFSGMYWENAFCIRSELSE